MRRPAPLNIKQKRYAYQGSQPLLPQNRSNQKQRAFDAATEFFKKYKTPLNDTLQSLFGTEFFGRAALWLDPYSQFQNENGIIVEANRFRQGKSFVHEGKVIDLYLNEFGENFNLEAPDVIFPIEMYEVGRSEEVILNEDATSFFDFMADTTSKSRKQALNYSTDEADQMPAPPYGEMEYLKHNVETVVDPHLVQRSNMQYTHLGMPGTFQHQQYSIDRVVQTCQIGGACTSVSGPVFVDDITAVAFDIMVHEGESLVKGAILSRRVSNLAYNVYELKDIPRLISQIGDLRSLVQKYVGNPLKKLSELDKDVSSLYLSWQFGVKSTYDAFKGLMDLPEKATKRLNHLIRRNGKVSTGRSSKSMVFDSSEFELPTFTFVLPNWMSVTDQEVTKTFEVELRCVVNQTIQFPQLAVPSINDKDYQRLLGVTPTAEDFYNIIPFSWLVDYFYGVGGYISILTAVHDDRALINYGFLTIDIVETTIHKANIEVADAESHSVIGVGLIESTSKVRKIPYLKKYTRTYQRRVSAGQLAGVKSAGTGEASLTDFQQSIIAALFSQRV